MAEKKKPPKLEDEAQSKRFIETARALESSGGLSPEEADRALDDLMDKAGPPRRRP